MIRSAACRRLAPLASAACACATVLTSMACAASARAQSAPPNSVPPMPPPPATTHLDFTLDTGSAAPPQQPAAAPAKPVSASGDSGRNQQPLPSRGASLSRDGFREAPSAAPPQVLAQLGTVTSSVGQIRIGRDTHSRLLSTVGSGANLAIVADGGAFWGVLMVNNTMGWVRKASVQLMDYRASVAAPIDTAATPAAPTPEPPTSAASSVAGSVAPPAQSDLDPRTTALLHEAFSYLGVPYVWAGNTRRGLDCSGFVCNVFGALGVHLPRHSGDQARIGQQVHGDDLRPGDRLYFDMGNHGEISHCGIYIGNGYFIHASTNHGRVDVDSVLKPNYRRALVCACRS